MLTTVTSTTQIILLSFSLHPLLRTDTLHIIMYLFVYSYIYK